MIVARRYDAAARLPGVNSFISWTIVCILKEVTHLTSPMPGANQISVVCVMPPCFVALVTFIALCFTPCASTSSKAPVVRVVVTVPPSGEATSMVHVSFSLAGNLMNVTGYPPSSSGSLLAPAADT